MAYEPINWKDFPNEETPLSSFNLNHMDTQIKKNADAVDVLKPFKTEAEKKLSQIDKELANSKVIEADGTNFELTTSEGGILIKHMEGASSQDGTPTPDNPIEIKSADVNITSRTANLIPFPFSTTADTSITLRAIGELKDELQFINDKFQIVRKCEEYRMADFNDSAIKSSGNDGENTCCYRWTIGTYTTIKDEPQDGLSNINIITKGGAVDIRKGYGYININTSGGVLVYLSVPKEINTLDKARAFAIEHDLKVLMRGDGEKIEEISNEDAIKLLGLKSWEDTTYLIQNNECNGAITLMYGTTPEIATSLRAKNIALSNERKIDDLTSALLETTSLME